MLFSVEHYINSLATKVRPQNTTPLLQSGFICNNDVFAPRIYINLLTCRSEFSNERLT